MSAKRKISRKVDKARSLAQAQHLQERHLLRSVLRPLKLTHDARALAWMFKDAQRDPEDRGD